MELIRYTLEQRVDARLIGVDPEDVAFEDNPDNDTTTIYYRRFGINHHVTARRTVFSEPVQVQPEGFQGTIATLFDETHGQIGLGISFAINDLPLDENRAMGERIILSEKNPLFALADIPNASIDVVALYRLRRDMAPLPTQES